MSRVEPLDSAEIPETARPILEFSQQVMGFTANDVLTMARWPELLQALQPMVAVIYGPGRLDDGLKRLLALVTSTAAGCRYCQAHTAHGADAVNVDPEKIAAAWEFETSDLFSDAERAALRIARNGATQSISDADFAELKAHFDDREIMEIVAVIALFGFLNRWNSALDTEIETVPATHLATLSRADP
jgi:uncharacterized peroxidase-related enzyme